MKRVVVKTLEGDDFVRLVPENDADRRELARMEARGDLAEGGVSPGDRHPEIAGVDEFARADGGRGRRRRARRSRS